MNKTENKTQVDFSNIRDLQNIIKTNGISKLAMGVKSFKQRLSLVGTKMTDAKKKAGETKKVEIKPVEPAPAVAPKVEEKPIVQKVSESKPEDQNKTQSQGDRRQGQFDNANRNNRQQTGMSGGYQNRQAGFQNRQGGFQGRNDPLPLVLTFQSFLFVLLVICLHCLHLFEYYLYLLILFLL